MLPSLRTTVSFGKTPKERIPSLPLPVPYPSVHTRAGVEAVTCMGAGMARRGTAAAKRQSRKECFKVAGTFMGEDNVANDKSKRKLV